MDHSFCVGSHLYGLFKILFDLIQRWLWVSCGLVFQMSFPYIPDNAVQIIMKDMAVKIVLLYLTQFQRPHMEKNKKQNKKVQFVVVREFSGDKTMREAFEQLIERQTCEHFEEWLEHREMAQKAA